MLQASSTSLTLKEIAPKWADRFKELPLPATSVKRITWGIQILFARTCVVGEAYGSDDYIEHCKKCRELGYGFVTSFICGSVDKLKKNEQFFVNHWNQEHSQVTKVQMLKRSAVNLIKLN